MSGIGLQGRRLQTAAFYLLLVLLPMSMAAIEITFGLLLVGWVMERLDPRTRRDTIWIRPALRALAWSVVAFLAVCAASVFVSTHPWHSIKGWTNKWLEYLLLCVIAADLSVRPRVAERGITALSCSAGLVLIEGLSQEVLGRGIFKGFKLQVFERMTGPYQNPIDLSTYLIVVFPVLLACALANRGWRRWWMGGFSAALLLAIIRAESIGAWLGLGTGLAAVVVLNREFRRVGLTALAVFMVIGIGMLAWAGHLNSALSPREFGKVDRWVCWVAAMRMIQDRPVLGFGLNTFMANYLDYWVGGERNPRYAHNCYLQMAAETGYIGLTAFLLLLGFLFVRIVSGWRQASPPQQVLLAGCMAGLMAFAVQAGIDTNFYSLRQAALFWVIAGLAVGLSVRSEARPEA